MPIKLGQQDGAPARPPGSLIDIELPAKRVLFVLMTIICALMIISLGTYQLILMGEGQGFAWSIRNNIIRLFNVDWEANVPTWYSSIALFAVAVLVIYIVSLKPPGDRYLWHWKLLAAAFVYLSLDEFAQLHETVNRPIREAFNTDGFLYYPWVVVAALCLVVFVAVYARFLWHLPPRTRWLFILSGAIFVSGAIVIESLSSYYETRHGIKSLSYQLAMTVEEFCEMTGVAIFIYALLEYINELRASSAT